MDEAIALMRAYWRDEHVNVEGAFYAADEMAMEPKPPQGGDLPIWIGGTKAPALRRAAEIGDGWSAMSAPGDPSLEDKLAQLHRFAEEADRDPDTIGLQMSLSPGAVDKEKRKRFYAEPDLIRQRLAELQELGFDWASMDCVPIFQLGIFIFWMWKITIFKIRSSFLRSVMLYSLQGIKRFKAIVISKTHKRKGRKLMIVRVTLHYYLFHNRIL